MRVATGDVDEKFSPPRTCPVIWIIGQAVNASCRSFGPPGCLPNSGHQRFKASLQRLSGSH
ncbi:hypothetical protein C3920_14330 [Novacetimonas pomaceti]|uniref:Uncharacterized protein n=1 Tax=Novacetimonas pomaceti TaxID=2021998 RepID=A0ABX5P167_9PROT|nr:hypothetical protein C3920_14330 [Novacetimonas pomaceti]